MTGSKEQFMEMREAEGIPAVTNDEITRHVNPVHLTKAASEGNAEQIAELVKEGHANALDVSTKLAWMITVLEKARKLIQADSVSEIEKHNGKATVNGAKIEKAETGTSYDYAGCGDTEWEHSDWEATAAANARKEREKFLKALTKPITIADERTGEMITVNPPVKSSTTNIKISFE